MITSKIGLALLAASALLLPACVPAELAHSPMVTSGLQMISAGHTGCLPADNAISNTKMNLDGSGTWNATCNGRLYLCSAFKGVNPSDSYSCAPAVAGSGTE